MKYKEYINSKDWEKRRKEFLEESPMCNICNKFSAEDVHHKNYNSLGNEDDEDLEGLCKRCHYGIHNFEPYIDDNVQRVKAIKIMRYFRLYPSIKTQVLNDVSRKYFDSRFMIDITREENNETPLFIQNLMEILYLRGIVIKEDIIEYALSKCINYKYKAGRSLFDKNKRLEFNKRNYPSLEKSEKPKFNIELTEEEAKEIKMSRFCMSILKDNEVLKEAKSHFNKKYYGSSIIFNNVGAKSASNFIVKLKLDNLLEDLFIWLGGDISEFKSI